MITHILLFTIVFISMEGAAWGLHKYVMHGFLWNVHLDHHRPKRGQKVQTNDIFAIVFAVPSFLLILFGTYFIDVHFATAGYGILAYGIVYFFVHEVLIHRRLPIQLPKNWYLDALLRAHGDHHSIAKKEGCCNFGMLVVPLRYFRAARKQGEKHL